MNLFKLQFFPTSESYRKHLFSGMPLFLFLFFALYNDSYAMGLTYGYDWILSRRWNLEVSAGIGAIRYRLARYTPGTAHPRPNDGGWIVAPTKLSVAFVYILK